MHTASHRVVYNFPWELQKHCSFALRYHIYKYGVRFDRLSHEYYPQLMIFVLLISDFLSFIYKTLSVCYAAV